MVLLVRNKVQDAAHWKRVFDAQKQVGCDAGLNLINLWKSVDDENQVFFLFDVEDRQRAEAYMSTPEAAVSWDVWGATARDWISPADARPSVTVSILMASAAPLKLVPSTLIRFTSVAA